MNKTIVTLACCALIAPLAFAQPSSTHKRQTATETITVTGAIITTTTERAAASDQPVKTLVVREDGSNNPGRYVLNGSNIPNGLGQTAKSTRDSYEGRLRELLDTLTWMESNESIAVTPLPLDQALN